ncbi:hypothetical protein [Salinigranum rubrum]|uniref:hypothetical protein n=1 Tax=Salinigranum rubrum TaxID=755307 RepID=UPI0013A597A2|nr:hypothetical protein [Salinigranum rubrum]
MASTLTHAKMICDLGSGENRNLSFLEDGQHAVERHLFGVLPTLVALSHHECPSVRADRSEYVPITEAGSWYRDTRKSYS